MEPQDSTIPPFRADGYLPEGLYLASVAEVTFRFGAGVETGTQLVLTAWTSSGRLLQCQERQN
jgi:hypothetical protein